MKEEIGITQERGKIKMEEKLKEGEELTVEEETVEEDVVESEDGNAEENAEEVVDESVEAPTPDSEEALVEEEEPKTEVEEKMLTQSQVNELVGRARQEGRESAMKELFNRYGVSAEPEMDDVFGKGQAYDSLNDEYTGMNDSYKAVMAENALLKSNIDMGRWDDVKLILSGNGLEITPENIESMLPSHPEWRATGVASTVEGEDGESTAPVKKPAVLRRLGSEISTQPDETVEEEKFKTLFGFK
jgi:hypothetical protein